MKIHCRPALLLAALLSGCAPTQTCRLPPSLSLTLYDGPQNAPAVMGVLGTTPAALLFDTGASTSVVSPSIAQQAGLSIEPIQGGSVIMSGMTGDVAAGLITAPQFTLGTATATNAQFVVATVFGSDSPLDGVLGNDFLRDYDIDLNIPLHNATLYHASACAAATLPWQGASAIVPFHEDKYGAIYLTVVIAGQSVEAELDTGSTISSMSQSLFQSAGLAASGTQLQKSLVSGISGTEVDAELYKFSDMLVGNVHIPAPLLLVYSPLDYTNAAKRARAHALARLGLQSEPLLDDSGNPYFILGRDFIGQHRLFISHSTGTLYIQASQPGG